MNLLKDLNAKVERLEKKTIPKENDEIREKVIDEVIVANSDAIKKMENETKTF